MITIKTCVVDYRTSEKELNSLVGLGFSPICCPPCPNLYTSVCGHPDMQMFFPDSKTVIVQKQISKKFIEHLQYAGIEILHSENNLTDKYPYDIILNAFIVGDFFVHNIKFTDKTIIDYLGSNKKFVSVKQGYSKCSTLVINDSAVITNDVTIAKALKDIGIDVLLLPHGNITLKGLDYGFIGGASGILDDGSVAFFGNINRYTYANDVKDFLKKYNMDIYCLYDGPLIDRGTLFCI
ncbi:DUF6873 family GME fold protein [Clostridium oryzae]|uniref:DUF6873 domain-containing protein n=1 Tax=Clostridium oryzae TaxID=1450648 RepID=A0A1V4IGH5_9CLOT|nr:hypothetical protein [Clostridium oryzae]OPJ59053.1 hypothetical protein CLORY_34680 [Clostridium oryzae]